MRRSLAHELFVNLVGVCVDEEVVTEVKGRSQRESLELGVCKQGGHLSLREGGGGGGEGRRGGGGKEGTRGRGQGARRVRCKPAVVPRIRRRKGTKCYSQ